MIRVSATWVGVLRRVWERQDWRLVSLDCIERS